MSDNQFSVYTTKNGKNTPEVRFVSLESAMNIASDCVSKDIDSLVVTDGDDMTNFEWSAKDGITYPKAEDYKAPGAKEAWDEIFPKKG